MSRVDKNPTVEVHPSQFQVAVKARLLDAVAQRRLPGRFLYDSPAQSARWLAYHAAWSPSRTEASLLELYDRAFDLALDQIRVPELDYVSLGCGGGTKDARFMARCRARGQAARAVLADTSPSLVVEAMLKSPGARGLVVDLDAAPDRADFVDGSAPVLVTAFGMVPNLDHERFLRWLSGFLVAGDRALVSANLHPDPWPKAAPAILPQYDNPEARAWYAGALAELGLPHARVEVSARPTQPDGGAWRVEVEAITDTETDLEVFDTQSRLHAGEALSVFFSNRFTPDAFSSELRAAGLEVEHRLLFEGEQEGDLAGADRGYRFQAPLTSRFVPLTWRAPSDSR